jgi:hypothetical protein
MKSFFFLAEPLLLIAGFVTIPNTVKQKISFQRQMICMAAKMSNNATGKYVKHVSTIRKKLVLPFSTHSN